MTGDAELSRPRSAPLRGFGKEPLRADEERTLARLRGLRSDLIDPAIAAHHGRTVKRTGDGSIIEFPSVVDAVRCAIEVQQGLIERNAGWLAQTSERAFDAAFLVPTPHPSPSATPRFAKKGTPFCASRDVCIA